MGFFGYVIANNLTELILGLCFLIVAGVGFTRLGRWRERRYWTKTLGYTDPRDTK